MKKYFSFQNFILIKYYTLAKELELSQYKLHQYNLHSALKFVHHIISLTTPHLQNNDISLIDKHNYLPRA